jgi:Type I restriction enzyme R protein N terminus (HSDR_N)
LLKKFDIKALNDPEFQEDAVREEIIAPILKHLGYSPSANPKIVRSRKLSHPFVNIGSKTNKINIIPDYVLEVDGKPMVVLDAKSPHVSLENSEHAEQAYSYAIHPEIRAKIYSLCNGKEWIIWDVDKFEPIAKISAADFLEDISIIEKYLHPKSIEFPERRDFLPDFGLRMKKMGISESTNQHFLMNEIGNIHKVEDDLYTINVSMNFGYEDLFISFDLNKKLYLELLDLFPDQTKQYITDCLSRQPYYVHGFDPILVTIKGNFGKLTTGVYEEFVPIIVTEIKSVTF